MPRSEKSADIRAAVIKAALITVSFSRCDKKGFLHFFKGMIAPKSHKSQRKGKMINATNKRITAYSFRG